VPAPAPAPREPAPSISLSPSALLYFFADRVVSHGGIGIYGVGVPCRPKKVKVKAKELAALQMAVALWNLREQRLIGLELVERKTRRGAPESRIMATVLQVAERDTLEGWLMKRLCDESSTGEVRMAFRIESGYGPPTIVDLGRHEAIALGYLEDGTYWRNHWEGKCAEIAALEPNFEDAWARWARFGQDEAALAAQLLEDCRHGLPIAVS
jgi:hypothetical protein